MEYFSYFLQHFLKGAPDVSIASNTYWGHYSQWSPQNLFIVVFVPDLTHVTLKASRSYPGFLARPPATKAAI